MSHTCEPCAEASFAALPGTTTLATDCGCRIDGQGTLPSPWHIHYCLTHAAAPALLALLRQVMDDDATREQYAGEWQRIVDDLG
jgi:hypothetical protein